MEWITYWPKEYFLIIRNGISMHEHGQNKWVLHKKLALDVLDKCEGLKGAIVGGDVFEEQEGIPKMNYSNWCCGREDRETDEAYITRSIQYAREYIAKYNNPGGLATYFDFVPQFFGEIVPWHHAVLDGKLMKSKDDLHTQLQNELGFPDYYGKNADALWDCLGDYVYKPICLEWRNYQHAFRNVGRDAKVALSVLEDFRSESEFSVEIIVNEQRMTVQRAMQFAKDCKQLGIAIIGFEGGRMEGSSFIPDLNVIADFSDCEVDSWEDFKLVCNESAINVLKQLDDENLVVELEIVSQPIYRRLYSRKD